jgi:hypothetical protein
MKSSLRLMACVAMAVGSQVFAGRVAAAADAHSWTVRHMLVNGTDDATLIGATNEVANQSRLRTDDMRALLAEVLAEINAGKTIAPETAVDIVRILSAAPDAHRYHAVIRDARRVSSKGMQQAQEAYLKRFRFSKKDLWVAGTVDLAALRRQAADASAIARPTLAQQKALASVKKNMTLDELFASVGTPVHAEPRDTRGAKAHGNIDVRQVHLFYRGIGRITYDYRHAVGWRPHARDLDPLAWEASLPHRRFAETRGPLDDTGLALTQLLSGRALPIRIAAIRLHGLETAPPEYLDAAAQLLLRDHASVTGDEMIDSYAWLCNVLADRGGLRYERVLDAVRQNGSTLKLRYTASQNTWKRFDKVARYKAGSVSLEELARRYPDPYPQIPSSTDREVAP